MRVKGDVACSRWPSGCEWQTQARHSCLTGFKSVSP